MRLLGSPDLGHLTYCTNIHAGESWHDVFASLKQHVPAIKAEVAPDQRFGIGLRLSAAASKALEDPAAMAAFTEFLGAGGLYVFTINGFPYGTFHGQRVKEDAYRPDWSERQRLTYTNALADQLAAWLPADMDGSVSTVPCTFKPWAGADRVAAITENLIAHAAHLVELRERTGTTVTLAIEPEPYCFLGTTREALSYFDSHLFSEAAAARLAAMTGLNPGAAAEALRRHVGLCYDVCHAAVEFEDPADSIAALRRAGIGIFKLQLSSALRVPQIVDGVADQLAPFDEPVYLHQTVQNRDGDLTRFLDLPDALAAFGAAGGTEWRIHFHVPVFLEHMKDFSTTQAFLREILALHSADPISPHLEVETYTWDVLPDHYRGVSISAAVARELAWVKRQLGV
jgi:sugar phosphate isomerase/epimerase